MIPRTVLPANQPQSNGVVKNSLRSRNSATPYLSRTFGTPTNQNKWTYSKWVKRGTLAAVMCIFGNKDPGSGAVAQFYFDANDHLRFYLSNTSGTVIDYTTNASFRDPAAHYHVVLSFDNTLATSLVTLTVNGSPITSWSTSTNSAAQNGGYVWNRSGLVHYSNVALNTSGAFIGYFDGVVSDEYFIDGQALPASAFGQVDAASGMWVPKVYTGSYGNNGFHLDFKDTSALTTSSNAGPGKDTSGNGNYLATTNYSITAGVTYDPSIDVPFPIDAVTANYPAFSSLGKNSGISLGQGGLAAAGSAITSASIRATFAMPPSGKFYWEFTTNLNTDASNALAFGLCPTTRAFDTAIGQSGDLAMYLVNTIRQYNGASYFVSSGTLPVAGNVIQVVADVSNGKLWFGVNNVFFDSSGGTTGNPAAGTNPTFTTTLAGLIPFAYFDLTIGTVYIYANFGQRPFSNTPPAGFLALNSNNWPTPSIVKPNKYFDAIPYTGNGATQSIVTPSGFAPDLILYKGRSTAYNWGAFDTIRGATKFMDTNDYAAELTYADTVTSFNSNGWSLGANNNPNASGTTYIGYAWKGGGAGVANSVGSIISTVSANPAAGVSVVSFIGTGANGTVGHGLGVAPGLVIVKARSGATSWGVLHNGMTPDSAMYLDQQNASASDTTRWNSTAPTSSVFSVGTSAGSNANGTTFIAYCFAAIPGYSAIGSYVGNGYGNGPLINLGFRPRFIMIKSKALVSNWLVFDSARDPANTNLMLREVDLNLVSVEGSAPAFDILSNGFKCLDAGGGATNYSGYPYIYMAFAESPFKYSLAR